MPYSRQSGKTYLAQDLPAASLHAGYVLCCLTFMNLYNWQLVKFLSFFDFNNTSLENQLLFNQKKNQLKKL